ncbi:Methyltransferase domain-containing protein [Asanoa hainanensis]|uniref:Methyltransferase domain-containing protein n=1 Tax=Asanoa hainanensis TaxID=560556 RepID=A0A239PG61_9ACTN|nr:class I SAM-dependent methyltransferase [Asanoa hainanensis]SNT65795.1 Methyltransferase domain-containing protein [Asanoa hainanensis]
MTYLDTTRSSYDVVAAGYSARFANDLPGEPVKRSMLTLFADLASGRVADVGCGPGHVTKFLHGRGLDVFGIDLSPGMVEQARANYPELRFEVGSMTALDHPDSSLSGVNAFFSTIHVPDANLPGVLAEFHRVLAPDAPLLLAFQAGDDTNHVAEVWGHEIDLTFHRRRPETIAAMLTDLGFHVVVTTVHEPADVQPPKRAAYLIARKRGRNE